ncbi:MAG: preprotein translocase subunit SecE [Bacteroidaceae bacterium]|jgi:preprotein translocase subunit SecE|nr:preprotein translocase subunit SecE [Bacteroidaceae bacterium]MBR3477674.1 preprotein translocase subunit SecE [Bacteroidaceae bacterium]MBR6893141.1 preprotein translocase subunit SecE [Bacteroidaceae bacterium]MCR4836747.1 preprotein translocase subunit SecE [Bacteroidaceae bacterium]
MITVKDITNYCKESYDELVHKTTWPTLKELTNSAVMVLTASIIIAIAVGCIDWVFENLMSMVYSLFN